ncbi:MAG: ABC transporter permease [Opitutaceae bacterium]|nr:ABC transporter permease [Opitutaceae bacterium]
MIADLRLALRALARTPGFTLVAVLTLALGIGLSTSSFSVTNALLLRALPYPESDRLVGLFCTIPENPRWSHTPANILDIRATATSFSALSLHIAGGASFAEPGQPPQQSLGLNVTADFLRTLGVKPNRGRDFTPDEDQPGKDSNIVILTDRAWRRRFASDPAIIGRPLRLDGALLTIIGVLPPSFDAPMIWGPVDFVRPFTLWPVFRTQRTDCWINSIARLKPGVTLAQAQSELATIAADLARAYPRENASYGLRVADLQASTLDGVTRGTAWMLTAFSALVLLIACANLAGLLSARALGRSREFAIRAALGASRIDLMRPLLVESGLLALGGGALGVLFGSWANRLLGPRLHISGTEALDLSLDGRVLAFALAASLLAALAFGLMPAWLASRAPAAASLNEGARGATTGRAHRRLKNTLIVAELALVLVLVGGATSFTYGVRRLLHRDLGWNYDQLFAGSLTLPFGRFGDDLRCRAFNEKLLFRLAALPGVEHAALSSNLPLFNYTSSGNLLIEGRPPVPTGQEPLVVTGSITAEFFTALRLPIEQGDTFRPDLKATDPAVAIVNASLARRFWPGENPLGHRVRLVDRDEWCEIVGVVGDATMAAGFGPPYSPLQFYRPLVQVPTRQLRIVLQTTPPPDALTQTVARVVAELDPDLPVADAGSVHHRLEESLAPMNLIVANLGVFAVLGLVLSALGLYGVIAHLTALRTRDIGVRLALGARRSAIVLMILQQGIGLLLAGLAVGLPASFAANLLLRRFMPALPTPGLWLPSAVVLLLALVTIIACWLPARRVSRLDPVRALRAE